MKSSQLHHSRDLHYRRPFGAIPCGTAVHLFLDTIEPFPVAVSLRLWSTSEGEKMLEPSKVDKEGDCLRYAFEFSAPPAPGLLWYHFVVRYEWKTVWYGAPPDGLGGEGVAYEAVPSEWQITVYKHGTSVPSWYTHGIMYQIFPDRFYRGDKAQELPALPAGALYHPHWSDWPFYAKDPQTGNIAAYDFFGGTLDGVIDKLPYLQSIGVTMIYLNPIFESVSNHKYDTGDYKKVDAQFGGDEGLQRLRQAADAAGIRLILDGVFSHTGDDSPYFQDAIRSKESPYYPWYSFSEYPGKYDCWWGVTTLPNVNEMEPSYREFVINAKDSVIKYWLQRGVSGWRLDVADELPGAFVQEMFRELKNENPDAVLIGEVWEDASHKQSYGVLREYLWGDELDSVINYPFRSAVLDFLIGDRDAGSAMRELASLCENYPPPYFYSTMNVLGTHDVPRTLTLLGGAPAEATLTKLEQARYRLPEGARRKAVERLKLAAFIQFTSPGVPCVYYGDEAGMEGYNDPQNRRTYPWGKEAPELVAWYRRLGELRQREPVLRTGRWVPLAAGPEVLAFGRRTDEGRDALGELMTDAAVVVLVNRSELPVECAVDVSAVCAGPLSEIFKETPLLWIPDENGLIKLTLPPLSVRILKAGVHVLFSRRSAGILLHPTSLPGPYGIGDLGAGAHAFVDWLAEAGQTFWQVLPLGPVDPTGSPYQSPSAFAGSLLMISPEDLRARGLIDKLIPLAGLCADRVEYETVTAWKEQLLREAFRAFRRSEEPGAYRQFCSDAADWLEDYALFMALKGANGGLPWIQWEPCAARRQPEALAVYRVSLAEEIAFHRFVQFIFFDQWEALHRHAASRGVRIVGDLPIFVAHDSADVWALPHLFALDRRGRPKTKAGVPPDYFSVTGQLWGNPHYDWEKQSAEDFGWWAARLRWIYRAVDVIRIDHFRGFEAFWEIPARYKTAVKGKWVKGPAGKLFCSLLGKNGPMPILAEDLGVITPEVVKLKDAFFMPGMAVLPFLFWLEGDGVHLPKLQPNTFYYTGTHDNDTLLGWLKSIHSGEPELYAAVSAYGGMKPTGSPQELVRPLIVSVLRSEARVAVVPIQDWLELDTEARMNLPGTCSGNWGWRLCGGELTPELACKIRQSVLETGRDLAGFAKDK